MDSSKRQESGFTLVELLIVTAIIAILAAIAIPQYSEYRTRAFDSGALQDLRAGATAQEAHFIENDVYVTCADSAACVAGLGALEEVSADVVLSMTAAAEGFTGEAFSSQGRETYTWNSASGGLQ